MKKYYLCLFLVISFLLIAQDDREGSDYPGINRLKGFYIGVYNQETDSYYNFAFGKKEKQVEGDFWEITYYLKDNTNKPEISSVTDHYKRVVSSLGGQIVYENSEELTGVVYSSKGELWIGLTVWDETKHTVYIVSPRQAELTSDLTKEDIAKQIKSFGKIILRGVNFPEDSAEINNLTAENLEVVASFLKVNPKGNYCFVGHTSTKGEADYNIRLSEKRAAAIVKYLVEKYAIDKERLSAKGVGFFSPQTSNDTPQGKKINERIELIKIN